MRSSAVCFVSLLLVLGSATGASAQRSFTGTSFDDFEAYGGNGLASAPATGQLDSDEWSVGRFTDAPNTCGFGASCGSATVRNDFSRGVSMAAVMTPGMYAFRTTSLILGFQPAGGDFDPGVLLFRLDNASGAPIRTLEVSFTFWYRNDQGSSTRWTTLIDPGTGAFTSIAGLTTATPMAVDASGWVRVPLRATIDLSATPIAVGGRFTFRFESAAVGIAVGQRDEIGIDDLRIVVPPCGNGTLDPGEVCDDGAANGSTFCGCQTTCQLGLVGTVCSVASGLCDLPDVCDGAGTCSTRVRAAGTRCRMAADLCDVSESCDGTSAACPSDAFAPPGTSCRASAGACDVVDTCSGTSVVCPADAFATGGECRPSAGLCDVPESCDGSGVLCPTDRFATSSVVCRGSAGVCDVAETCSGTGAACGIDIVIADGTPCADPLACNGAETCTSGICAPGAAPSCDDSDLCTTDACTEPTGACSNVAVAGCCNLDVDCDDGALCTVDVCSGPGGTCMHQPRKNCCATDADCADPSACSTDSCDLATNTCSHVGVPGCCTTAAECDDGASCTTDTCGTGGTCSWSPIASCCAGDGDCADTDSCTMDRCVASSCVHDEIALCCLADADCTAPDACSTVACDASTNRCTTTPVSCDDGDACTTDACTAATGACTHTGTCDDGGTGTDAGPRDGGPGVDGGRPSGDASLDAHVIAPPPAEGGCACTVSGAHSPGGALLAFLALAAVAIRRRRQLGPTS